jgi:cell filamentation protein
MYRAADDPYCYPGSSILKNLANLKTQAALDEFELAFVSQRSDELFPAGRLSAAHYRKVHKHLFQDVYAWAGRYRTVRISKGSSSFCYPENIAREMAKLFETLKRQSFLRNLQPVAFAVGAASFLAELNAIHPFREGNGRSQLAFMSILADAAGYQFQHHLIDAESFLDAMISSFNGDLKPLDRQLFSVMAKRN